MSEVVLSLPTTIALIGLGSRTLNKVIPVLTEESSFSIVAAVDPDPVQRQRILSQCPDTALFSSVEEMLQELHTRPTMAYVAAPHDKHADIVIALLAAKIHVLKEKPGALSVREFEELVSLSESEDVKLAVAAQKRFSEAYDVFQQWIDKIGNIRAVEMVSKVPIPNLADGWRSRKSSAGGGVTVDLGYHALDRLVQLFGLPVGESPAVP